jgi:Tfp pilus assembly protein PilF
VSSQVEERWQRIGELFDELADLGAAERAARLDAACGGDPGLRAEVESLLRHDATAQQGLAAAVLSAADSVGEENWSAGRTIGPWRLVRELGEGGMGSVWLGERADGAFEQQVAIKRIRPGFERGDLVERFAAERRFLAGLVHPAIARLWDAGSTAAGRPYFVMEYVDGRPIQDFCADLPIARRLEIFLAVAGAVAFAHQKLVVHRDLKPGNILVTAAGEPKLLDFGIAKWISLEEGAAQTMAGAFAFSPEYASPEQVKGEAITTATDVYGLGAVLYELLTGRQAQPIEANTPAAIYRGVCLERPRLPSEAAPELRRELAGDLDAIVMKALRKEPEQRYAGAAELADDLRRHLAAEPVRAAAGSWAYKSGRFLRRHRAAAAAAALVVLSLVAGLLAATWQARRAERRFDQVRHLATRFLFDFDRAIAPLPGSTEARRMVIATAVEHLDGLAAEAGGDPTLQLELAQAFFRLGRVQGSFDSANLGLRSEALASFAKSRDLAERLAKEEPLPDHLEALAMTRLETAITLISMARYPEARAELEQGLAVARRLPAGGRDTEAHRRILSSLLLRLADIQRENGEPAAARNSLEEALENTTSATTTLARLGLVARDLGDLEGARAYFEKALAGRGPRRTSCYLRSDLAGVFFSADGPSLGRAEEASAWVDQAVECGEALVAADGRDAGVFQILFETLAVAGGIYAATDPPRGLELLGRAAAHLERSAALAPQAFEPELEMALLDLARTRALAGLGRPAEAARLAERSLPVLAAAVGRKAEPRIADALWLSHLRLGQLHQQAGESGAAAEAYRRALSLARQGSAAQPNRPAHRFFVAESAEHLARLLATGEVAAEREEARLLAAEAAELWSAWKREGLTAAYADRRLAALQAFEKAAS